MYIMLYFDVIDSFACCICFCLLTSSQIAMFEQHRRPRLLFPCFVCVRSGQVYTKHTCAVPLSLCTLSTCIHITSHTSYIRAIYFFFL